MIARLISLLALAALALQGLAPAAMAAPQGAGLDHVWCGKAAPSPAAEAAVLAALEAAGLSPAPAPAEHDSACKFCCSAFFTPAALIPAPAGAVPAPAAGPVRWAVAAIAAPPARATAPHPPRGPPAA